jgi:hypothetical protein
MKFLFSIRGLRIIEEKAIEPTRVVETCSCRPAVCTIYIGRHEVDFRKA